MAKLVIGDREYDSQEAFVRGGRRCGTPDLNEFQKARVRAHLRTARANGMDASAVTRLEIPVHVHVIHDGATGALSDQEIDAQLNVLNDAFKPHDIVFTRASVDRTDDPRSEEHTSELQSRQYLVCRLPLDKKKAHYPHAPVH